MGSSSNLICLFLFLIVRLLLLLSGDVELNPGPTIDDRPDVSLLIEWLDPLVDWKPFAYYLPEMTHSDISKIQAENINKKVDDQKLALYSKWLDIAPNATWKDVITALNTRREYKLVKDIKRNLQKHTTDSAPVALNTRRQYKLVQDIKRNLQKHTTDSAPVALNTRREYKLVQDIKRNLQKRTTDSAPEATGQPVTVDRPRSIPRVRRYYNLVDLDTKTTPFVPPASASARALTGRVRALTGRARAGALTASARAPVRALTAPHIVAPARARIAPVPRGTKGVVWLRETKEKAREKVMFKTPEDEKEILCKLIDLNESFSSLIMHVRSGLDKKNESDPKLLVNFKRWLEAHMKRNVKLTNASLLDDAFEIIDPFYDFIDCALIVDMSKVFLGDFKFGEKKLSIVSELEKYQVEADKLYSSTKVKHLNKALKKVFEKHIPNITNMPTILMKLHNQWHASKIHGLSLLIHNLLPVGLQQSLMKYITITSGCVIVKYAVCGYKADNLIEHAGGKLQFMRLIGIFSLYINDHAILQEDENMDFTFELALLEAVTAGHNEAVEFLLQLETVYIDHINEEGKTALMLACERGHEDIVHSLTSAGANVNLQDNNGWTALMRASEHNHISIINMLLQANANHHLKKSDGSNALIIASFDGHYEVVELLIGIGVDYKYQRKNGWNAFMVACQNGHTRIVELLLKEQVDPNVQKENGFNAFMAACENGHTQIVELLLKEQVDPNVQDNDGWNAFMLACQNGHTQIVELLLKEKVDPNVQNKDGWNAFMLACQNGHTQIVELLLKEQVDPNVQNKDGWNAFMLACQNSHTQIVELLLKEQVDPNVQNKDGWNAFMLACQNGHTQIVELLLKIKVDPNVQNKDSTNAFMLACKNGYTQIVELLLKEKVDPNVQNKDGWNAFMLACQNGHTQIVELLLKEKVDPNVQNKDDWNAFMLACQNGHTQIVELLLKEKVDPNVQNKDGWNAFMAACQNGHTQIVELLLKAKQVDPNVQNKNGFELLWWLVKMVILK